MYKVLFLIIGCLLSSNALSVSKIEGFAVGYKVKPEVVQSMGVVWVNKTGGYYRECNAGYWPVEPESPFNKDRKVAFIDRVYHSDDPSWTLFRLQFSSSNYVTAIKARRKIDPKASLSLLASRAVNRYGQPKEIKVYSGPNGNELMSSEISGITDKSTLFRLSYEDIIHTEYGPTKVTTEFVFTGDATNSVMYEKTNHTLQINSSAVGPYDLSVNTDEIAMLNWYAEAHKCIYLQEKKVADKVYLP